MAKELNMKVEPHWAYKNQDGMTIMYMGEMLTPSYFIGGVAEKSRRFQNWKEGAELIRKLMKSGILYFDGAASPTEDLSWFYTELRGNDPFGDGTGLWMAQQLGLTPRGREIVERHQVQLSDDDFDYGFIEEIENIFESVGG